MTTNDTEFGRLRTESLGIFIQVVPYGIGILWSTWYWMLAMPLHTVRSNQLLSRARKSRSIKGHALVKKL